jgi:hypothetical protein
MAIPRHIATDVVCLGVIDAIPGIGNNFLSIAPELAIVPKTGANITVG